MIFLKTTPITLPSAYRLVIAICTVLLTACIETMPIKTPQMFASASAKKLVQTHRLLTIRPSLQTYLDAQYQKFSAQPNASVLLFGEQAPFALLIDSSRVAISCGLISLTDTDADLAFVLAHEAGHLTLKHYLLDHPGPQEELQADKLALKTMVSHGYSTENTHKLFAKLYQRNEHLNQEYPSTKERLYQLWSMREDLGQNKFRHTSASSTRLIDLKTSCRDQK